MALEDLSGPSKFITALVPGNPTSADDRREGDDHIRGIKNVLRNTFPGLAGAVDLTNAAGGQFLPLTGGTLTGGLTITTTSGGVLETRGTTPMVRFSSAAGAARAEIMDMGTGSVRINAGGKFFYFQTDGVYIIGPAGSAGKPGGGPFFDSNSDVRMKRNVQPYTRGLSDILAYKPVSYQFTKETGEGDKVYVGRLAHEVKAVDPSMVMLAPQQTKGYSDLETIDSNADMYKVFNAIKALHERIEALEAR
jgi:hypothetical protein